MKEVKIGHCVDMNGMIRVNVDAYNQYWVISAFSHALQDEAGEAEQKL